MKSTDQKELLSLDQLIGSSLVEVTFTREELEVTLREEEVFALKSDQEDSVKSQYKSLVISFMAFHSYKSLLLFLDVYKKDGIKEGKGRVLGALGLVLVKLEAQPTYSSKRA